jgi:hypothetical protein
MANPFQGLVVINLFVEAVSWGMHSMVYLWSIHALSSSKRPPKRFGLWIIAAFSTTLFAVGTLDLVVNFYLCLKNLAIIDGIPINVPTAVLMEYVSRIPPSNHGCGRLVNLSYSKPTYLFIVCLGTHFWFAKLIILMSPAISQNFDRSIACMSFSCAGGLFVWLRQCCGWDS